MRLQILDHGYVELIETWGSEQRIVEAARMSTQKGFEGWGPLRCKTCGGDSPITGIDCVVCKNTGQVAGDERLLAHLWTHKHTTPFEMAGMTLEVMAPIFVFREWHRHRTQSYNEASARYAPLPDVNYLPTIERLMMDGGSNKQAQSTGAQLTTAAASTFRELLEQRYHAAQLLYIEALKAGVPKELARLVLPVGRYSKMRASGNLLNWLRFLTLRTHSDAQWEIRQYAIGIAGIVEQIFPRVSNLWMLHK